MFRRIHTSLYRVGKVLLFLCTESKSSSLLKRKPLFAWWSSRHTRKKAWRPASLLSVSARATRCTLFAICAACSPKTDSLRCFLGFDKSTSLGPLGRDSPPPFRCPRALLATLSKTATPAATAAVVKSHKVYLPGLLIVRSMQM